MRDPVINGTYFHFPAQTAAHHGKVRDIYDFGDSLMLVATDRYSAFDRNLALIAHKGELLTAISRWWFEHTKAIIKNHIIDYPDPNVVWCHKYKVVPIEMVVRGYITGVTATSLWHNYSHGQRNFGNFTLPRGLHKNQKLPKPVLTPTTKFEEHDRPLTPKQAIKEKLVTADVWERMQEVALKLFKYGQREAHARGLILVDTKYEFGLDERHNLILIDELHTPDSSRYWRVDDYQHKIDKVEEPDNYDKEFLRLWYKARFDPYKDKAAPKPPKQVLNELRDRYMYVYEHLTGQKFTPSQGDPVPRIEANITAALKDNP